MPNVYCTFIEKYFEYLNYSAKYEIKGKKYVEYDNLQKIKKNILNLQKVCGMRFLFSFLEIATNLNFILFTFRNVFLHIKFK